MIVIALLVTVTLIGNLKARLLAMEAQGSGGSKARNDFLSRMSHDIRTPLENGILGMTRLAQGNRIHRGQRLPG